MKTKLLFLFSIFALYLNAQNPALISNTWYLTKLTLNNVDYPAPNNSEVSSIILKFDPTQQTYPPIYTKVCNSLSGSVTHATTNDQFTITSSVITLIMCQQTVNNNYEYTYFYNFFGTPGTLNNPYNYVINPITNGNQLIITNSQGNKAYYNSFYLTNKEVDSKKLKIEISENPVKNSLKLTNTDSATKIKIYDTQGKLVLQKEQSSSQKYNGEIDVKHISKGMYYVIVFKNDEAIFTEKFIKE